MRRNSRSWILVFAVVGTAIFTSAAPLLAGPGNCDGSGGRGQGRGGQQGGLLGGDIEAMAEWLDLSDSQVSQVEAVRDEREEASHSLRMELRRTQHAIEGEWLQDQPDEETILSLVEKTGQLRMEMAKSRIEDRFALREILNEDQIQKLEQAPRRERRSGKEGNGGRRGARQG